MRNADHSLTSSTTTQNNDFPDTTSLQILWASILFSHLGIPVIKISILSQYLNFFIWPKYRNASWVLLAGVAGFGIASVVVSILACIPVQAFWTIVEDRTPQCVNIQAFAIATAAWDVLTNTLILLLPMLAVARWAQPTAERWAFAGMYGLGAVACIASGMRLYGLHIGDVMRASGDNTSLWISTTVEFNLIILCASLPTLRPLIDHCFPGFLSNWCDSGRRPSYTRTWLKLKGRCESPHPPNGSAVELRGAGGLDPPRPPSALSQASAPSNTPSDAPTMVSVSTNKRGSAHPGALVIIPEDLERGTNQMPSRFWVKE